MKKLLRLRSRVRELEYSMQNNFYTRARVSGDPGTWNSAPDVFISMRGEAGSIKDMNIDWRGS